MQRRHGLIVRTTPLDAATENVTGTLHQSLLPVLNLVRMHIKLLSQFSQRPILAQCRQCHLRLKLR